MASSASNGTSLISASIQPDKILEGLQSRQKSDRDHGLAVVEELLKVTTGQCQLDNPALAEQCIETLSDFKTLLLDNLKKTAQHDESINDGTLTELTWEEQHGSLSAALAVIAKTVDATSEKSRRYLIEMQEIALGLICYDDVRVRILAGDMIGSLCRQLGPGVYEACREVIKDAIQAELQYNPSAEDMEHSVVNGDTSSSVFNMETDQNEFECANPVAASSFSHDTNGSDIRGSSFDKITVFEASPKGVRSSKLETLLKCLIHVVGALGPQFKIYIDQEFVEAILTTSQHHNRFVREVGFSLCSVLLDSGCIDYDVFGTAFADKLSTGLSDLCSQTRIAAGIATRKHILGVHASQREKFFPILLPRLCLCRYFMADTKFLLYSQESWRLIVDTNGPQLVEKYMNEVVNYYLEATRFENHAVREAACACIAELSRKINPDAVRPFIPTLLEALKRSFHDERWHVRDSACLGCGNFVMNFPEECRTERDNLLGLFYENLGFPISIVRQGAAASIANIIRVYGTEVLPGVIERIIYGMGSVTRQLPDDACFGFTSLTISPETRYSYPPGPWTQFIPYARPSQPWELGDGCLYLIGDIAPIPECQTHLSPLIPHIIKASQARSYSQHVLFLETVCKIVPPLAKGIGKKPFKEFLAAFFEPIFYSIECENPQTAASGKMCLQQLALMFGPNILKSRIEQFDSRFVHYMEGF